jgi:hypothetical protein
MKNEKFCCETFEDHFSRKFIEDLGEQNERRFWLAFIDKWTAIYSVEFYFCPFCGKELPTTTSLSR